MGEKSSSGSDFSLSSVGSLYFNILCLSDIEILDTNNIAQSESSCHVNIRTNSLMRKNYILLPFARRREQKTNKYFPVSPQSSPRNCCKILFKANEVTHSELDK